MLVAFFSALAGFRGGRRGERVAVAGKWTREGLAVVVELLVAGLVVGRTMDDRRKGASNRDRRTSGG